MTGIDFDDMEFYASTPPGLEAEALAEIRAKGFAGAEAATGGVRFRGSFAEGARACLMLRGAGRVLARIGGFRALHLAQLDKRSRKFPWGEILRPDIPVKVDATCHRSKIYHDRAAAQRVATAIREELGAPKAAAEETGPMVRLLVRIEDDMATFSVDLSGEPLHRRGLKPAVAKAPMRETLAALMLMRMGYDGREPVLDPMCGSGTFILEAADMALGLPAGRARGFAFEHLANFHAPAWEAMKAAAMPALPPAPERPQLVGTDRNRGAVEAAQTNADIAGIAPYVRFSRRTVSEMAPPEGARAGLLIVNPPYGDRIGDIGELRALYGTFGKLALERFRGWRVGMATTEDALARTTGLPWLPAEAPIAHGGLKVRLYRTAPLP